MSGPSATWIVDLDGVIWLAEEPIAGSADAVGRLRAAGIRVVFATNNAAPRVAELIERLNRAGIDCSRDELVTSAHAAASMLDAGSSAFPCAEGGVIEALEERGIRAVERGEADAVVVGWTKAFDFDLMADAATRIREGARFIGTNEDATHPTPERLLPGSGALLAAVATAAQAVPEVAGKPHEPMVRLLMERAPGATVVVGDRPSTDGELARRLGLPFALVRTGVTQGGREPIVVTPDHDAPDLSSLVDTLV